VPSFYRALLAVPEFGRLPLRLCISGGAPLPVEVFNEFTRKFPFPLREGYGPTESSPVATVNPIYGINKPGSIGKPIPNVELSIRDEAGQELPVGAIGEICIRGGNVMRGYWNQPEETTKVLRDGWLYTGDVGYRDADGYYYITDRKKDMLLVNGINVYPREIEEVIYQFPGVKEAAVIGVPDARKGEQPVAFVTAAEGQVVEEKSLLQFVRGKLADYKMPKWVIFTSALPRNATGKILKTELRKRAVN
jgi:long-chain acyl-CoA synthetase